MNKKTPEQEPGVTSGYTVHSDFQALSQAFSLPDIDYHHISRCEQLSASLKRWPLLAELADRK